MKKVKFSRGGRWADPQPHIPQIEVEAGVILEVSDALAENIVASKAGVIVSDEPSKHVQSKQEKSPAKRDKAKAEG